MVTTFCPAADRAGIWQDRVASPSSKNRAGPAQPFAAAVFGPGQPQIGAQHPQQGALAVHFQANGLAV